MEDYSVKEQQRVRRREEEISRTEKKREEMRARFSFLSKGKSKQRKDSDEAEDEDTEDSDAPPKGLANVIGRKKVVENPRRGYVDVSQSDMYASMKLRQLMTGTGDDGIDYDVAEEFDDDDVDMEHEEEMVDDPDAQLQLEDELSEDDEKPNQNSNNSKGSKRKGVFEDADEMEGEKGEGGVEDEN